MTIVYFASCLRLPEPDPDEALLLGAVPGSAVRPWDDPRVDWSEADLVVIRSTWNYHLHRDAFVEWAARVATTSRLYNSPEIVRWNSHKSYLRELSERGFRMVPTVFVDRGAPASLTAICAERGWTDVVVKPAVSGGSFSTKRFRGEMLDGDAFLTALSTERDVMVQPYVHSVDGHGERSMIWIAGELTHAIRKTPRFAGTEEQVSAALPIADDERAFALGVVESAGNDLLYARIDLARDEDGRLMVMELELIEPSLFLLQSPYALARFASAILQRGV